jgi:hypothetical protein
MMKSIVWDADRTAAGELGQAKPQEQWQPTRLIANIVQGTDPVRRRHERPTELPPISHADRSRLLQILARDPAGNQSHRSRSGAPVLSNRFLAHRAATSLQMLSKRLAR